MRVGLEHEWWKGSFPLWIVVVLLGIIGWMVRREIGENDRFHGELASQTQQAILRITLLEAQYKTIHESLVRIETYENATRDKLDALLGNRRQNPP